MDELKEEELRKIFGNTIDGLHEWYNRYGGPTVENRKMVKKKFHEIDTVAAVYSMIP